MRSMSLMSGKELCFQVPPKTFSAREITGASICNQYPSFQLP